MIRPFGLRDALVVRHLQSQGIVFDMKRRLLNSSSPLRSALLGLVGGHPHRARTLVHTGSNGSDPLAFVQLMPREDGVTWDLVGLAPWADDEVDYACVPTFGLSQDLLSRAIIIAAQQKVARIYARPPCDDGSEILLRRSGFAVVGCEEVFFSASEPASAVMPTGLRSTQEDDSFLLETLYRQVIPPLVFLAQWPTGDDSMTFAQALGSEGESYVWIDEGDVQAHLSLESSARGHWIDCVVRPERRADVLPYIRYLLSLTRGSAARPVYFVVPDYAVGLGWLLRTLGFESRGRQQVMVAHTISRVQVARPIVVQGLEGRAEVVSR